MTDRRTARLNEQLKREVSEILTRKVRDPRVGHLLVTEVRVTADLWLARIFYRPLLSEADIQEIQEGLEAAAPFIRKELGSVLRVRRIPELRFIHDTTPDSAARIEDLLREVLPPGDEAGEDGVENDETPTNPAAGEFDPLERD
ncbi:MAG: 30S ribosome-binding factor RbfA [Gemmatimonadota bacterium]